MCTTAIEQPSSLPDGPYDHMSDGEYSVVLADQNVGVREVADHVWLISFMDYDLGFFDDQCSRVECAPNPFGAKVLPMSPV